MHPHTSEILDHLDHHHARVRAAVDGVPIALRQRRPAPDRWSVSEVLEHLALVTRGFTRLFRARVTEARQRGLGADPDTSSVLARLDVAAVVDRGRAIDAVASARPSANRDAEESWAALDDAHGQLRAAVLEADGLALGELTFGHPVFGMLDFHQWLVFMGAHESRHAEQIREAGRELVASAGTPPATPIT